MRQFKDAGAGGAAAERSAGDADIRLPLAENGGRQHRGREHQHQQLVYTIRPWKVPQICLIRNRRLRKLETKCYSGKREDLYLFHVCPGGHHRRGKRFMQAAGAVL